MEENSDKNAFSNSLGLPHPELNAGSQTQNPFQIKINLFGVDYRHEPQRFKPPVFTKP